jgi:hypothetical protein
MVEMIVKHVVEKPDGSLVFQGVLEGNELAFVIEMGMEAIIKAGAVPFASTENHDIHDIHTLPDEIQ